MPPSPARSPTSRPLDQETIVQAELFKILIGGSPTNELYSAAGAIGIASVFLAMDRGIGASAGVWVWCALSIFIVVGGAWIVKRAKQDQQDPRRLLKHSGRLITYGTAIGISWGATSWIFLPVSSQASEAFLIVSMALVVVGSAGVQAAHRNMQLASTLSCALVFAAGLARLGDGFHIGIAIVFSIYGLLALSFARNLQTAVRQQVLSTLENQSLRASAETERARADAASEAKTAFLAAASHDLRQPLHALVQYSAHLDRISRDSASRELELDDTVRRIRSSTDSMRDLLDSMLDLSKLMVGGVKPIVAAFPIDKLLDRLDAQLQPLATMKGLQFSTQRHSAVVMSDDVLLERILRNLILNSIRYTNQGRVMVRCRQRRDTLHVQVWDTGIGIPQRDLQRIFDPFYQIDNRARDRRKGLGLGLAIVRQLCELLGHRINVRAKIGTGTVFVIGVPLCTDPSMLGSVQPSGMLSVRDYVHGACIILIDDDTLSRDASVRTLQAFGCRVIAAASGVEIVAKLETQEFPPQLIVADYRLEAETGIEVIQVVTERLRNQFGETFSLPALLVSGDTAPDALRRVKDLGYPMLHKPVSADDLWGALNRLLEQKAQEAEF